MKTILLQPEYGILYITEPCDSEKAQDRHLHFVFPAPVCPDIEELYFYLEKPCTVSFEPDLVLLPKLSALGAQSFGGTALECLFEVLDAPALGELGLIGAARLPEALYQKTSLKHIDLHRVETPVIIPDDIRSLVNLEYFKLFDSEISYLSPEIFRLPHIREISFYRLRYEPTPEVVVAAEAFVAAGGCLDQPYGEGPLTFQGLSPESHNT